MARRLLRGRTCLRSVFTKPLNCAFEIAVKHRRMYVTLPADRAGVSKPGCHRVNRFHDVLPRLSYRTERLQLTERRARQHGSRPRSEVFRRELLAANLAQVIIHVGRINTMMA